MLADTLRSLAGTHLKDEDGNEETLELLAPATAAELSALEARIPCPLPDEIRDALRVTTGLANGPLETFSLLDLEGFGFEELLPDAYSIAHDGFGNYWVLDLIPGASEWGPVFYACHDPAVLAFQSRSIEQFLLEAVAMHTGQGRSVVDVVHEDVVSEIWRDSKGLTLAGTLAGAADPELRAFVSSVPTDALIADLRSPKLGDGFSWGRFGPRTVIQRAGPSRLWVLQPPVKQPGFLGRLFGGG